MSIAALRATRTAAGLCAACLRRAATTGHATCRKCRKEMRRRDAERRARQLREQRAVYFARAADGSGPIKIGSASDVERRLRELQTGSPVRLHLVGVVARGGAQLELGLHRRFADLRQHGEWYAPSRDLLATIAELTGGPAPPEAG